MQKKFVSVVSLAQHKLVQHKKHQQLFKCTKCYITCTTPYTLRVHMKDAHKLDMDISEAKGRAVTVVMSTKGR